jgi:hypothetical protein
MFFCCVYCVLSGRGLCDELIARPERSYRLWCVVVCDHETSWYEEAVARAELQSQRNKHTAGLNGDPRYNNLIENSVLFKYNCLWTVFST